MYLLLAPYGVCFGCWGSLHQCAMTAVVIGEGERGDRWSVIFAPLPYSLPSLSSHREEVVSNQWLDRLY